MEMILLFIALGLIAGVLAGLLGIGGGVITVPALYYIFLFFGFPGEKLMQIAIATALASTILTSIGATGSHHRKKNVLYPLLKITAPGLVLGCILGAILAHFLPSGDLRAIFGIIAILFAVYFFFPMLPFDIAPRPNKTLSLLAIVYGTFSSLLGIGGGIFMVPTFIGYHVPMKNTIATSSAGTLVTALVGTLAYLVIAWDLPSLPHTVGYIEIPAFLAVGFCSLFTTPIGVHLAHTLPANLIKRIFAVALAATGLAMLLGK